MRLNNSGRSDDKPPRLASTSLVPSTGRTMKSAENKTMDTARVPPSWRSLSCSSSSREWLAEIIKALIPIASDSPRTRQPRSKGRLSQGYRSAARGSGNRSTAIDSSGRRHATDQDAGPRIMTPSRTACPPIEGRLGSASALTPVGSGRLGCGGLRLRRGGRRTVTRVLALEAFDPAPGVDQLLLARVEGMALVAQLDVQLGLDRPGRERVPARTRHPRLHVVGMNSLLHRASFQLSWSAERLSSLRCCSRRRRASS